MINLTWKKERIFSAKSRTFKTKSWPFPKEKLYIFQYKIFPHLADFPYLHYCSIGQIKKTTSKSRNRIFKAKFDFQKQDSDFQKQKWDFGLSEGTVGLSKRKILLKKKKDFLQKVGVSKPKSRLFK